MVSANRFPAFDAIPKDGEIAGVQLLSMRESGGDVWGGGEWQYPTNSLRRFFKVMAGM